MINRKNFVNGAFVLLACVTFDLLASNSLEPAPILQLDRAGPVFEKPSSKSKILADAPEGMLVMGRALSSRKSWVLIEDESGFQGWFPKAWTNWNSVHQELPPSEAAPRYRNPQLPSDPESAEKEFASDSKPRDSGRKSSFLQGWGLGYDWKKAFNQGKAHRSALMINYMNQDRKDRFGVYGIWAPSTKEWGASFLARFALGPSFFREIDFGFRKRQNSDISYTSADLGFSVGTYVASQFALGIRGGLLGFSDSEWSLSGRLIWHF